MIRRFVLPGIALALAGCAQTTTTASRVAPRPTAPPGVPIPPAPPAAGAPAFINLPPANLRGLLGQPHFVRQDSGTEMWRYDGAACRAFFFFQGPAGAQTVRHVETLPAGSASSADPLCLSALRAAAKPAT